MSVTTATRDQVERAARELDAWGWERRWTGTDPYEGLNATRALARPLRRTPLGRRILIQAVKRSPLDLRPLLGISREQSSAALAWVATAYALDGFLAPDESRARLDWTLAALDRLRSPHFDEPAWSYHFDVETRVFFYARTTPNTIATAFAAAANLDAYEATGERALLETAIGAGDFFLRHVPQTEAPGGAYFGYLPGDRSPIHNSNLMVCGLLARLGEHVERPDFAAAARAGVGYALAHQRPDGSWPYGERPNLGWVDNFHTGYVLDSMMICAEAGVDERIEPALERGLDYYRRTMFLPDGTPKYFSGSIYPIDAQSAAQAIQTFSLASHRDPTYADMARRVLRFALARMRNADGSFVFQRRRLWANRAPHVRWVQAPMLMALAHMLASGAAG